MRSLLLVTAIVAFLLLPMGCVDTEQMTQDAIDKITQHTTGTYTIKVGGTAGLYFAGEYEAYFYELDPYTYAMDFTGSEFLVEGQVPAEYSFVAMSTAGYFQKQTGDGSLLRVEVWKDGVLQDSASTMDPWGAVMIAGGP